MCIDGVRVSSRATYLTLTGFFEPATTINKGLSSSLVAAVDAVVAAVDAMMGLEMRCGRLDVVCAVADWETTKLLEVCMSAEGANFQLRLQPMHMGRHVALLRPTLALCFKPQNTAIASAQSTESNSKTPFNIVHHGIGSNSFNCYKHSNTNRLNSEGVWSCHDSRHCIRQGGCDCEQVRQASQSQFPHPCFTNNNTASQLQRCNSRRGLSCSWQGSHLVGTSGRQGQQGLPRLHRHCW